ncbi:hypothetical protein ACFLZP_02295 [Patescibacteria group bacterium]
MNKQLIKENLSWVFLLTNLSLGYRAGDVITKVGRTIPRHSENNFPNLLVALLAEGRINSSLHFGILPRNISLGHLATTKTGWRKPHFPKLLLEKTFEVLNLSRKKNDPGGSKITHLQMFLRRLPTKDLSEVDEKTYYRTYLDANVLPPSFLWIAREASRWKSADAIAAQVPGFMTYSKLSTRAIISSGLNFLDHANRDLTRFYSPELRPGRIAQKNRQSEIEEMVTTLQIIVRKHWRERK